ncbi:MAG: hypothetical protein ACK4VO_07500 [Pseudobdellovibrio sp.]
MKYLFLILTLFISLQPFSTLAAGQDRGGGKGIVCKDNKNQIQSVELLDIWEARRSGIQFPNSPDNATNQLTNALERSRIPVSEMWGGSQYHFDNFFARIAYDFLTCTDPKQTCPTSTYAYYERIYGKALPLSNDSLEGDLNLPANCAVEQIVSYYKGNSYYLNMDLVVHMNALNLAGLAIHESIYHELYSLNSEENSQRVRRFVSFVMSGQTLQPKVSYLKAPYITCGKWDNGYWDRLNFMQDPKSKTPKIIALIDYHGSGYVINFHNGQVSSATLEPNTDVETFYNWLVRKDLSHKIKISGEATDIEFLTEFSLNIVSGDGVMVLDRRTGNGIYPRAKPENVSCRLIK